MLLKYLKAMETQAAWATFLRDYMPEIGVAIANAQGAECASATIATVDTILQFGTPSYMHEEFCDLVNRQRDGFPDDVGFDPTWLPSHCGFLWCEKPPICFVSSSDAYEGFAGHAIGWVRLDDCTQFAVFVALSDNRFAPATCFRIADGFRISDGFRELWKVDEPLLTRDRVEEIRWVYTAFFLMSQKITAVSEEKASSMVRSMARRKGRSIQPSIKIVSFRKRQYSHNTTGESNREYHCQWIVDWHIRRQPYKNGVVKPILIDSYVKGPADKPLKPVAKKLFIARY